LQTFAAATCTNGQCVYPMTVVGCSAGCDAGLGRCMLDCANGAADVPLTNDDFYSSGTWLAWTGNELGVSWRSTLSSGDATGTIELARVAPDGTRIGGQRSVTQGGIAHRPRMAFAQDRYAIAWSDIRDQNNEIYVALSEREGTTIERRLTNSPMALSFPGSIGARADNGEVAVVWSEGSRSPGAPLYFALLDQSGSMTTEPLLIGELDATAEYAAVTWTGRAWAVAWYEWRVDRFGVFLNLVSSDGRSASGAKDLAGAGSSGILADLAWNGSELAVVWEDYRNGDPAVYFQRFDASGNLLQEAANISSGGNGRNPVIAWTGEVWSVVFISNRDGVDQLYLTSLDASGLELGGFERVTCGDKQVYEPSIAFIGDGLAIAWTQLDEPDPEVYLKLLR
jgi:hypothetical protein